MTLDVEAVASTLATRGKGILAADETPGTLSRRFKAKGVESTPETRRTYREMLFSPLGLEDYVSGVILQDETLRQSNASGAPFARMLAERGILAGIKVDMGAKPLAGRPDETVTEGLDGLRDRLAEYRGLGAKFTKWRAVFRVSNVLPTAGCIEANAHALARYAALAQEQGLAPIVEPEVLMEGDHGLERCDEVTGEVLQAVFAELHRADVVLEAILLKPNMVVAGKDCPRQPSIHEVAAATLRRLRRHVPPATPGIVFLSGGQSALLATAHLDAINRLPGARPWTVSFSYGRALQDPALEAWGGDDMRLTAGAQALLHRARCNGAAALGEYAPDTHETPIAAGLAPTAASPSTLRH